MNDDITDIKGLEQIEKWLKTLPEAKLLEAYELLSSQEDEDDFLLIDE